MTDEQRRNHRFQKMLLFQRLENALESLLILCEGDTAAFEKHVAPSIFPSTENAKAALKIPTYRKDTTEADQIIHPA